MSNFLLIAILNGLDYNPAEYLEFSTKKQRKLLFVLFLFQYIRLCLNKIKVFFQKIKQNQHKQSNKKKHILVKCINYRLRKE